MVRVTPSVNERTGRQRAPAEVIADMFCWVCGKLDLGRVASLARLIMTTLDGGNLRR